MISTRVADASITAIAAGHDFTCVLVSGGSVSCWGYNDLGDLGIDSTSGTLNPTTVNLGGDETYCFHSAHKTSMDLLSCFALITFLIQSAQVRLSQHCPRVTTTCAY